MIRATLLALAILGAVSAMASGMEAGRLFQTLLACGLLVVIGVVFESLTNDDEGGRMDP